MAKTLVPKPLGHAPQSTAPRLYALHSAKPWPELPGRGAVSASAELPGRTLWLGPNEWLLVADESGAAAALAAWQARLQADDWLIDVSDAYAVWSLRGAHWRQRLSGFVPQDLGSDHLPAGQVVRSRLHSVPAIIEARGDDELWLLVPRSYGHYVEELLLAGGI